ncbi:peptidylprolyl isomerase [Nodularia sp. NIES-3585]|uniref:peptidylprolyl isomerase n=1 Tax=Nodularia sp. NIES-3585 TaxID=1973477 RepID=UPI000B5C90A3|nr:peptidylprolyl isomerase [Nodularia sp. NIES-3585]GAX36790.1 PpiC-type peptidyl-prolyl cis-trans isomerase [Nodularia sp. NIES-3585]
MSQPITITSEDILEQIKLACKIPEIVEQIVIRKIITSTAEEADIKVEVEELQKAADQLRVVAKLENADETWKWLQKHSLSIKEFEDIIYHTIISSKLAKHIVADQVEPYFFQNQLNYFSAVIYEIVLDDEELAMELFYAIHEGEVSFHDVACQYIQDKELRRQGGYRGIVYRKDLKPEISAAVFAAKPPQLIKPIMTSRGAYLILVEEIIQPELEKLRPKILADLFNSWIKQQIDQTEVIIGFNSEN